MAYFIPALDLSSTLVPAAILTTVTVITVGSVLKVWIAESGLRSLHRYDEDDDVEDGKPEPPIVQCNGQTRYPSPSSILKNKPKNQNFSDIQPETVCEKIHCI